MIDHNYLVHQESYLEKVREHLRDKGMIINMPNIDPDSSKYSLSDSLRLSRPALAVLSLWSGNNDCKLYAG